MWWTHRFFADNHLLNLHDLRDVVSSWFEWCSTRPIVDADENVSVYVLATIDTFHPTTELITITLETSSSAIAERPRCRVG